MGLIGVLLCVKCPVGPHRGYQLYTMVVLWAPISLLYPHGCSPSWSALPKALLWVCSWGSLSTPGSFATKATLRPLPGSIGSVPLGATLTCLWVPISAPLRSCRRPGVFPIPPLICGALRHPNQVRTPVPRCRVNGIQLMSFLFLKNTHKITFICCSVTKSWPTLQPHVLQHGRLPCPSLFTRVCSDSCTLSLLMSSNHLILYSCLLHLP